MHVTFKPIAFLPHITADVNTFFPLHRLRWGTLQTTCECLRLSYIYKSSTSIHSKFLNTVQQQRSNRNMWLIVCSFFEAYLMNFPSRKGVCIQHCHKKWVTIRHDRLKTPQSLFIHISQDKTLPSAGIFFQNAKKYKKTCKVTKEIVKMCSVH